MALRKCVSCPEMISDLGGDDWHKTCYKCREKASRYQKIRNAEIKEEKMAKKKIVDSRTAAAVGRLIQLEWTPEQIANDLGLTVIGVKQMIGRLMADKNCGSLKKLKEILDKEEQEEILRIEREIEDDLGDLKIR